LATVRIKLNSGGVRELLRSSEVENDLKGRAQRIAAAAGEGMVATSTVGRRRALAMVRTASTKAMVAEATERRLTMAIDAGRSR
jgi:hypothetical protein